MTKTTAQEHFHRWLEARRWCREEESPFSIGLEGTDRALCRRIGRRVAQYLSEVDGGSPGGWLLFDRDLVTAVADEQEVAELAEAFPSIASSTAASGTQRHCEFLSSVAHLGSAVIYLPSACKTLRSHPNLFLAGVRESPGQQRGPSSVRGDLTVDLGRLGLDTAVRVIADSALEWAAARPSSEPSNVTPWRS